GTKLAGQVVATLVMVLPGYHLIGPGELLGLGHLHLPPLDAVLDVAVTTVFVVGLVNAFNMLDGLDGLAGGAAAAALAWLAAVAAQSGVTSALMHMLLLLAALLGFLIFNVRHPWRQRASVFMGDAGSMMLGAAIAFFMLDLSDGTRGTVPLPALLWLVALPTFDTIILIARRLALGHSPLSGDRRHVHHLLLRAGFSSQTATLLLVATCLFYGGIGVASWYFAVPEHLVLIALIAPFAAQLYLVLHGWRLIEHVRSVVSGQPPVAADSLPQPGPGFP
ncbi:MAG: undecaprenyl/decaprenyl-phosphate alpha-N-acetylglucosaminyl 1-phosphate transferase, partial [Acetobacteraceae bacterium]|nr:undecaprenyl/decaprenyl-phosphate alpha-N-acetylglucosaminyl 1-phosphate transferase [Acetobacteraceae bacterium]